MLGKIGERLDAIEGRLERKENSVAKPAVILADGRVDASGGPLLHGVKAIAEFLGVRKRQAQGLVERGELPHFNIGRNICASRQALAAWLNAQAGVTRPNTQEE